MPARFLLFLLFILNCGAGISQGIRGKLTDAANTPVPFAAIYDETTYAGTTSNAEGYYDLKLEPGKHSIVFKALGYYIVRRNLTTSAGYTNMDIQLNEQPVEMKEVVVTPGKEDPAYAIMRKVIARAPFHLNQVKEYQADVYLRGTIHLVKIPKIIAKNTEINGKKNVLKSGDVYLEESLNQLHFQAPDKYDQKVISFHSTFPGNDNTVNPMSIIRSSLYEPEIQDIISPLSQKAFNYYNYKYEGFFYEGNNTIFKIKVAPKHNNKQLLAGTLYIIDQLWCLHSADLSQHMFFGDLSYKTIYSPVKSSAWLPISYQFNVDADMMGIVANFKYASSVKFSQVILNDKNLLKETKEEKAIIKEKLPAQTKTDLRKQKEQQQIEELLSKEKLTDREMIKLSSLMTKQAKPDTAESKSLEIKDPVQKVDIEKGALKKDTAYWNAIRPIPLTSIESKLPGMKDSTSKDNNVALSGKDSITIGSSSKKSGKVMNFIFGNTGFYAFDSTLHVTYNGLIGFKKIDFNTVDGFVYRQTFGLEQKIDSSHRLKIDPGVAYAFSRQRFMWWTDIHYDYAPMKLGNVHFHIGSVSADYNTESGINPTINSIASLFFRRNYMKLYQQNQVYLTNKIDLANGLNLAATVGYRYAAPLENHSDYSFFYRDEREYTPNIPNDNPENHLRNLANEEAWWDIQLEYTPQYYYKVWGGRKHYQHSKYPTLFIRNRMTLPGLVQSNGADYDLLEFGARQRIEWGMMHAFSWNVKAGFFLNHDQVFLMDDKYFNNQDLPFVLGNTETAFRQLPAYSNATTRSYAEAHITFTTPYLLIKYLPFLSSKIWCENLHLNYLTTNTEKNYWEIGYSISQIYLIGHIGVYAGFREATFKSVGVQVSVDL
jgi:hypothetical protein